MKCRLSGNFSTLESCDSLFTLKLIKFPVVWEKKIFCCSPCDVVRWKTWRKSHDDLRCLFVYSRAERMIRVESSDSRGNELIKGKHRVERSLSVD